jgi:hypothetical protein
MQRGLRFNADSKELWLEYFRLELAHVEMLRRRRIVLGLDGVSVQTPQLEQYLINRIE